MFHKNTEIQKLLITKKFKENYVVWHFPEVTETWFSLNLFETDTFNKAQNFLKESLVAIQPAWFFEIFVIKTWTLGKILNVHETEQDEIEQRNRI